MIREKIQKALQEVLEELEIETDEVQLEHPADLAHGDYSTNAALVIAQDKEGDPRAFAEQVIKELNEKLPQDVERVKVAGPGFINFYLSSDFFTGSLKKIQKQGGRFGRNKRLKGSQIMIEYTDPNPFKEFHIGHLMSNTIGESLARIIEWQGADLKRANYQGDVGMHVAKAVWGMKELASRPTGGVEMSGDDATLREKVEFLGKAYAHGATRFEEAGDVKTAIEQINRQLYEENDEEIMNLYRWGREASLAYFETIYKRLGTTFDFYFFESETAPVGQKMVLEFAKKGIFKESNGAYIFPGEKYGLHTRVFINKSGFATYEAKELALADLKFSAYKYDQSVVITGSEVDEYFRVVLKAMEFVYPELAEKTLHIGHGMLRLSTGKMSSRTGDVIAAETLLNNVYKEALEQMRDRQMPKEEKHIVAEKVAVAAVKYSILKQKIGKDIIFDPEKSLSLEGDSGPYLQYTTVRARSVLQEAHDRGLTPDVKKADEVGELERLLYRFPEVVESAYDERAPQHIVTYLTDIAGAFNSYYAEKRIIDSGDSVPYRLALTEAVATVLENGLELLGITVPERM